MVPELSIQVLLACMRGNLIKKRRHESTKIWGNVRRFRRKHFEC